MACSSSDGRELSYSTRSGIAAVAVEAQDGILRSGVPKLLFSTGGGVDFQGPLVAGEPYTPFDVAPNGQRFVVIEPPAGQGGSDHVRLVTNFFAELDRIAPVE